MRTGEVHLWRGSLEASARIAELQTFLAPDELQRAAQFRFDEHRNRFIIGRAFLRTILSRYTSREPRELQFEVGAHGKPALREATDVCFNVAHSEDRLLIAVASKAVGVDVEVKRAIPDVDSLATMVFSDAELARWHRLPLQRRSTDRFLGLWTRKEALLKGIGLGITEHLKEVSVFFDEDGVVTVPSSLTTERWTLKTTVESDHVWSLAASFEPSEVTSFLLD